MPVYFFQVGGDPSDAPVKIGFTTNPAQRLMTLQNAHYRDCVFLRVIEGEASDETRIHRLFQHLRIRGEWFRFDPAMLGDLGARDMLCPVAPIPTLRGGAMPQTHRAAISAGLIRSWATGRLLETHDQQRSEATV